MGIGNPENPLEDFDIDAAVGDISDDLFGQDQEESSKDGEELQGGQEGEGSSSEPTEGKSDDLPAQTSVKKTPEELAAEAAAEAATGVEPPSTWTNEEKAIWAKIPPEGQKAILRREEDMFRGLEQYREKADLGTKYDSVVEPYRAALAAENIDPVGLFQAFAGNHYLLSRGTPEQKLSIAANLIQGYGIPIDALKERLGAVTPPNPEVAELRQKLAQLESGVQTREQQEFEAKRQDFARQVEAFGSDPNNRYFKEVASDMANLLKAGVATTLSQAYEMAVFNNPTTRQQEVDRLAAEKAEAAKTEEKARLDKVALARGARVNSSQKSRDGTVPVGTMEETLQKTFEEIQGRA